MKVIDKYYVGLDLGTSSVGWAVTDDKYQLFSNNLEPAYYVTVVLHLS